MKPLVNLSSTPFRNRRLFWLAILLLFIIPAYFGMQMVETASRVDRAISEQESKTMTAEAQLKSVNKPVISKFAVSSEENKQLVAASELIARRTFSWSELLSDIERSLPPGVRVLRVAVTQIHPNERAEIFDGADNFATLNLNVIGKNRQDVTTMINRMHDLGRFKVFPMNSKAVEGTEDIEFELKVEYTPRTSVSRGNQIAASQTSTRVAEKK
ncbi:MAG: hypothetical protein ABI977_13600 [Acidobacteriota bacterium]